MKKQSIWVFEWRQSVHYWWSYILFSPECKELTSMLDPLLYRWGVPPVVIRCVRWTMQSGVQQTWIKALGIANVMKYPNLINPTMHLSHVPQCTTLEQKCAHFCSKVVHCGIWDRAIVGFVRLVYWVPGKILIFWVSTHWGKIVIILQMIFSSHFFFYENGFILIQIWLIFVPMGLINNKPPLILIMIWPWTGDKPLSEPMMA